MSAGARLLVLLAAYIAGWVMYFSQAVSGQPNMAALFAFLVFCVAMGGIGGSLFADWMDER